MTPPIDIGYLEAWQMWFAGDELRSCRLWGLEIMWWSRGSKILGLLAAMTIAVEIIGVDRLKEFASKLNALAAWNSSVSAGAGVWKSSIGNTRAFARLFTRDGTGPLSWILKSLPLLLIVGSCILAYKIAELVVQVLFMSEVAGGMIIVAAFLSIIMAIFLSLLLIVLYISAVLLIVIATMCVGVFGMVSTLLVGSAAGGSLFVSRHVLAHPRLATNVRVASLVMILIAFHFDFMAS